MDDYESESTDFNSEYVQNKIGKTLSQNYTDLMTKPVWDYDDFIYAIKFFWDFELIPGSKQPENAINYLIGLAHPSSEDPLIQNYTPDEITAWLADPSNTSLTKTQFAFAYMKVMQKPLTPFQLSLLSHNVKQYDWYSYQDLSNLFWVKHMLKPNGDAGVGSITVFWGDLGSGKTDMSLKQWEHLQNLHLLGDYEKRLATNIKIYDKGYESTYVVTIGEMLHSIFQNNIDGASTFLALDELTINGIRKKRTMAKETTNFDEIDRALRKFGADVSYIWHFDTEIPKETQRRASLLVHKLGSSNKPKLRSRAFIVKQDGTYKKTFRIKGIESTNLNFDSGALAYLVLDIRFKEFIDRSAKLSKDNLDKKEYYRELLAIVDGMMNETKDDELENEMEKKGFTRQELIEKFHISWPTLIKYIKLGYFIPNGFYEGLETFEIASGFDVNARKWKKTTN